MVLPSQGQERSETRLTETSTFGFGPQSNTMVAMVTHKFSVWHKATAIAHPQWRLGIANWDGRQVKGDGGLE